MCEPELKPAISDISQPNIADLHTVVLCGGRGQRLQPITDMLPKPMVEFHGKPMLDHIIDFLRRKGLGQFTLCVGYKANIIRDHYSSNVSDVRMHFSDIGENASMLARLKAPIKSVGDRFLCVYGDTFIDLDLMSMFQAHLNHKADITIVTTKVKSPFGIVKADDVGRVTYFEEKPTMNYYIGCFLAERGIIENINDELVALPDGQGLVALFKKLAETQRLLAFEHTGLQLTFNTPTELEDVANLLGKFYTMNEKVG